jgi:hypothetical protein
MLQLSHHLHPCHVEDIYYYTVLLYLNKKNQEPAWKLPFKNQNPIPQPASQSLEKDELTESMQTRMPATFLY